MDRIRVYTGGIASCNGYLMKTGENSYVAIDAPEGFAQWILARKPDIKITDLLITHQHFDHVEDAAEMKRLFGCKIHAGSAYNEDLTLIKLAHNSWGVPINLKAFEVDEVLGDDIHTANWGGLLWHIHHVPGHSPDSIVYNLPDEELMFTGDVLFAGSIGRTDLPGGNSRLLNHELQTKVLTQPATTRILPGHGPYSTIKSELLTNPFIS